MPTLWISQKARCNLLKQKKYFEWQVLQNSFPSRGGGGGNGTRHRTKSRLKSETDQKFHALDMSKMGKSEKSQFTNNEKKQTRNERQRKKMMN